MKKLLTPPSLPVSLPTWAESKTELIGFFYDYICNSKSEIIGLRYWNLGNQSFITDEVFSQFIEDKRFNFDSDNSYVTIVFDEESISLIEKGEYGIIFSQDFGDCHLLEYNGTYALLIDTSDWQFATDDIIWQTSC